MNYFAVILGIFVGSLIGNSLGYFISNKKRRKKNDGGSCCVCKYHALTLTEKLEDENGNVYIDENSVHVCTNPKSGCKNVSPEFRCKHFKWCYK